MQDVSNPYLGWRYDVGPGGYDRTHNAVVNFIYDLPIFRHSSSRLIKSTIGGWQVSGILTFESGIPINIGLSGAQGSNGLPNATNRPDLLSKISYPQTVLAGQQKIQYINPASFVLPTIGAFGDLGHNALRGPGRDNWNLSLFKAFVFSEARGSQFELRLETFNTFNHPQIQSVPTGFGSSNFGQPNGFFPGRIVQLGGKISF